MVNDLLHIIKCQFYADAPPKQWFQDRSFLMRNVVLWPAKWLNERAWRLPPERYKALLIGVFNDIKRHGATGAVKYWPGYLMQCVQSHCKIHTEEIEAEAKSTRTAAERVLMSFGKMEIKKESTMVDELATLRNLLSRPKPKAKPQPKAQGELF